jgi:proliferating cell nuclear antigen PCNA
MKRYKITHILFYTMEITITNAAKADLFASIFQNIRPFTEHLSVSFTPDGLYLQTMDSARVSIIELTIGKEWFDSYTCAADVVLGIPVIILFKILNAREKVQTIQVIYESDGRDTLSIHFTSDDKTIFNKYFQCPLLDIESETMQIPAIEYSAEFSLPSAMFSTLINQLKTFGDSLDISCTEEQIDLAANSAESGKMSVQVNIDDLSSFSINEGEKLNISFSLTQLHHISMFHKVAKEVSLGLCDQYPMSVQYVFGEGCSLRAFLAPKITDTD